MNIILIFIIWIIIILTSHRKVQTFITEKNDSPIRKMSKIYQRFINLHTNTHIIETLQVNSDHYIVKVYNSKSNITSIYKLDFNGNSNIIHTPFLLNDHDNDLNILEKSKELTSYDKFNLRY